MRTILLFAIAGLIVLSGCSQAKPVKTIGNLKAGIKGETTASAKYAAFAQKAREEGKMTVAKLFDAASKAESIHAANHRKVLEELGEKMEDFTPQFEVRSTAENLQAAIDGETYEVNTMYPQFLNDAKAEKVKKAEKSFTWAFDTEKKHQQFYTRDLAFLKANAPERSSVEYSVCPTCGNTYDKATLDAKCSFCQTDRTKFITI